MIRTAMPTTVVLISMLVISMLQGCAESPAARVAGTYELDTDAMKAAMQAEIDQMEDEMEKMGASMMLGMIDGMSMTLTLNEDGTASGVVVMNGEEDPASGTWTLDGDAISITMASEGGSPEEVTGTLDGDTIRMPSPGGQMPIDMVFKRQRS
ncbi:MAG: hypothetical protein ABL309_13555 [Phycisphaerales bacterium]